MDYTLSSGSSEAQGRRDTMEDTHKHIDDVKAVPEFNQLNNFTKIAYYGVFDGHGGDQTAKMVENALHPKILGSEEFTRGNISAALEKGFEEMDKVVVEEANKHNWMNGSTCVVGLVLDGTLYIANIGDSEGILISVSNGAAVPHNMTKPHKATDPSEKERIEQLGGHVFFGRVFGALAVSRSFGDAKYKKPKTSKDFVSWEPAIETIKLIPDHKYLILACDGLWDVMSHKEVADLTHKSFDEGKTPSEVARLLVRTALNKKTEDNVTVIAVKIDWTQTDKNNEGVNNNPTENVNTEKKKEDQQHKEDHTTQHSHNHNETTQHHEPAVHEHEHDVHQPAVRLPAGHQPAGHEHVVHQPAHYTQIPHEHDHATHPVPHHHQPADHYGEEVSKNEVSKNEESIQHQDQQQER